MNLWTEIILCNCEAYFYQNVVSLCDLNLWHCASHANNFLRSASCLALVAWSSSSACVFFLPVLLLCKIEPVDPKLIVFLNGFSMWNCCMRNLCSEFLMTLHLLQLYLLYINMQNDCMWPRDLTTTPTQSVGMSWQVSISNPTESD